MPKAPSSSSSSRPALRRNQVKFIIVLAVVRTDSFMIAGLPILPQAQACEFSDVQ
jgi:hypothetical protein